MVSVSTEHEQQSIGADFGRVALSCVWLNPSDDTEVRVRQSSRGTSSKGSAMGHLGVHSAVKSSLMASSLSVLSLSHLVEIGVEALVSIFDNEGVLH